MNNNTGSNPCSSGNDDENHQSTYDDNASIYEALANMDMSQVDEHVHEAQHVAGSVRLSSFMLFVFHLKSPLSTPVTVSQCWTHQAKYQTMATDSMAFL